MGDHWSQINDEITFHRDEIKNLNTGLAKKWKKARNTAPRDILVKQTITGPHMLARFSVNERTDLYPDDCALARAYAKVITEELKQVVNEGCNDIQFDEPVWTENTRETDWAADILNEIIDQFPSVNFNLHGDMKPSTVSVVDPETMIEIKQIQTGSMPHGSRISSDGLYHYSVAMMSDELFEIDAVSLKVNRVLKLNDNINLMNDKMDHSSMNHTMTHTKVKPTWVIPHPSNNKLYIAANGSNEIIEVDVDSWKITDKFKTGKGPYNIEISPNGKLLVVTYKNDGSTAIWDIALKKELKVIKNKRNVSHGVAISSDSKYAFISVEGVGGEPGTVDIINLETLNLISSVNTGKQAGGIAFWKISH